MKKIITKLSFSIFTLLFASCVSLTDEEKNFAANNDIQEIKSPAKAAGLSFLPGVGNLYLASAKDRPSQQKNDQLGGVAIANWVTWPVSILWSVPQAYIDAERINIQEAAITEKLTAAK